MKNLKVNVILALVALLLAALVLPQPAAGVSADYTYRAILPAGYQSASFESLNESGVAVGQCKDRAGVEWGFIYYLFTGKFTFIKPDGLKSAAATSINESGVVVGSGMDGSGTWKGFIYDPAATKPYTELLPKGWESAMATHINDAGTVVGYGRKRAADKSFTSFIYAAGDFTEIDLLPDLWNVQATGINNNGMVVGTATSTVEDRGFLYDLGTGELTVMDPGGWTWTGALNINQLDEVAGWGEDASGNRGYLYSEGDYTELSHDTLPYTVANDVSDSGLVVGTLNDNPGYPGCIGFIYDSNYSTYFKLAPGWHTLAPRAVSSRGVVVGWCLETEEGPEKAFVAIPPEAARVALELTDKDAFARNYEAYQRALDGVTPDASFIAESVLKLLR